MATALSIAGSDSIGGAGIQADIKAMTSLGVHATTVITAVTAQNTCEVAGIHPLPASFIEAQLIAVLEDAEVKAAKTGMLYSAAAVDAVAKLWPTEIPLVVDPVLVAGVGDRLHGEDLVDSIKRRLFPLATVITPNRSEAGELSGIEVRDEESALRACEVIGAAGAAVLLKGGHMDEVEGLPAGGEARVVDFYYRDGEHRTIEYPRLQRAGHGGGCTLAAFIASHLALGHDLDAAVYRSRRLIQRSIASMFSVGTGEKLVEPQAPAHARQEELEAYLALEHAWGATPDSLRERARSIHLLQTHHSRQDDCRYDSWAMTLRDDEWVRSEGVIPTGLNDNLSSETGGRVLLRLRDAVDVSSLPIDILPLEVSDGQTTQIMSCAENAPEALRLLLEMWCPP